MSTTAHRRSGRPKNLELRRRRREEILDAAGELFAIRGYSGTDTQSLADQLQVGKGTIYRYFKTKRELFLATVDRVMKRLMEAVDAAIAEVEDPFAKMARCIEAYLDFFARQPQLIELLIQERAQFKDRKRPTYFEYREANKGRWGDMLREMIACGQVRDISVECVLEVVGDLLYGTMFANYFTGRRRSPAEQTRGILDITLYGILSDAQRRQRAGSAATNPDAELE